MWFSVLKYFGVLLCLANHKILANSFDNIHRQGLEVVDREYSFHLSQQANE